MYDEIERRVYESSLYNQPVVRGSELRGKDRQELDSFRGREAAIKAKEGQKQAFNAGGQAALEQIALKEQERQADIGLLDALNASIDNNPNWDAPTITSETPQYFLEQDQYTPERASLSEEEGLNQLAAELNNLA